MISFPLKVMVIDDDKDVLILMDNHLSKNSELEVILFDNPEKALEVLKEGEVKVVFTDISMPEMSGEQLIRELMDLRLGIQVVALTGYKSLMVTHSCFRAGARYFLKKPITTKDIEDIMDRLVSDLKTWNQLFLDSRKDKQSA